ncbi:MAG: hypothetical protein GX145_00465 [Clostridiaceae bacterium]|jgi:hypothetical protein|nr:hypothetical protein [Clostridiaceae bacterium]
MKDYTIKDKKNTWKWITVIIACLAVIGSLILLSHYNKQADYESSFGDFLEDGEYESALKLYREVQNYATDNSATAQEKERYRNLQSSYEKLVETRVEKIIEQLKLGDNLSSDNAAFVKELNEVTGAAISPILNRETESWLDGVIDYHHWNHLVATFKDFPNLKVNVDNLLKQTEQLKLAAEKFAEASKLENIDEWSLAWQKWQEIIDDPEIGRFAQNYAEYRLGIFQKNIYQDLILLADRHIEGGRYYSAKIILDRLFDAFPNESEITEKLQICNDKLPNQIKTWEGSVEHIAIRPLIVDVERAEQGPYKTFAETGLLTTGEFEKLLSELYERDYVLISGETYMNYPEEYPQVIVPLGKKPLVMIFNQYQYSTQYKESGTAEQLFYEAETNQFLSRLVANKPETAVENKDAVSILNNFISEHTDFSFNGAKARISLTVDENVLGYTVSEEQTQNTIQKTEELGLETYILADKTDEDKEKYYQLQSNDLQELITALKQHGYTFCNGTRNGSDLSAMSYAELVQNISSWNDLMIPYLGNVSSLAFPGGANVYHDVAKLEYLIDSGYCTFYGEGPNVYNFDGIDYLHFDFTSINGSTLSSAEHWNLDRFLDVADVMEDWRNEK